MDLFDLNDAISFRLQIAGKPISARFIYPIGKWKYYHHHWPSFELLKYYVGQLDRSNLIEQAANGAFIQPNHRTAYENDVFVSTYPNKICYSKKPTIKYYDGAHEKNPQK